MTSGKPLWLPNGKGSSAAENSKFARGKAPAAAAAGEVTVVDFSVGDSVTVIDDLVGVVAALAARRASGVFHATNPGTLRHRDLLALYREVVDPSHRCELIGEGELVARGLAAAPRSNCVLASPRLAELGLAMRPIGVALADVMSRYAADLRARAPQPGA